MFRFILFVMILSAAGNAFALRCGTKVISRGDDLLKVQSECGKPTRSEQWVENRVVYLNAAHWAVARDVDPVVVNLWTYNFGRLRFMEQLKFENGRLVRIRSLGYGY